MFCYCEHIYHTTLLCPHCSLSADNFFWHLLHSDLLEVVPGPGEHILTCHFWHLDLLAPANTLLGVTFCTRTC